ncbi:NAD(P)-dependent alcohol dehydrogenase [Pseudonocardia sp.]|uniref:NAD(P)-dependent alcohol dehydrogenase n=1 Tax=Pseudonocardia sp. TaxID=60912 RepID=UPI00261F3311|nr:NAD(P)-dependent alcohol dehydrogenase [Pseudonocardia sp.]MCW2719405.1 putative oxidoreductase, Zn-dependent and NAD(P)-binding [Pseudonocardia sp.]MDT7617078.1 alcohol dehydrogenase [Pseudonocardiales bacterium]
MTTTVNAYATPAAKAPFEKTTIVRCDLKPSDVLIDIRFAGICHSDIHTAREEWGSTTFPLVPGHEIAGVVSEVGSGVTKYQVGDRVGVGCMVDSCRECENCKAGEEQYCLRGNVGTYGGVLDGTPTDGGYSEKIVVDEKYVLGIPEGIELDVAAPLLCAGITLYSPLRHWGAGPGKNVAIVGMGGLGHMGVKIAHALGAEVTVLSQSLSKKEDGERFGADHYYATSDDATFEQLAGTFDLIVNTVSAPLPMDRYLGLLGLDGTIVNVGAPSEPLEVPAFALIPMRRSWAGSMIGGIRETQEMLEFCAEHGLGAEIEVIDASRIDEAYDRVVDSDVRYRFVIDVATMA